MKAKMAYRELCKTDLTIPLFSKDWWMDAVCGQDNWEVLLVEYGGDIVASMPIYTKNKFGLKYATNPKLTQTQGVHIRYPTGQKYEKKLGFEKDVMNEIISKIDQLNIVYFQQNFHYSIQNWQPFFWNGYKQTTRYTSVIPDLSDLSTVLDNFSKGARKDIRRAERDAFIFETEDIDLFYRLNLKTFERQGLTPPYNFSEIKRIDDACKERNSRVLLAAQDLHGNIHSIIYLIWDTESAYLLMSGTDTDYRDSNFKTLLVWEAIKYASAVTKKFDFEGSMMENVADYNRKFGGILMPYYSIHKALKGRLVFEMYRSLSGY